MSFVRTVLGDIDPADLGVCSAHEHVIIDRSFTTWVEHSAKIKIIVICISFVCIDNGIVIDGHSEQLALQFYETKGFLALQDDLQ